MEKKGDAFDMDDFWAIEKLVPKKEKPAVLRRSSDISAIEITSDLTQNAGGGNEGDALTVKYVPRRRETAAPDDEYEPSSPLIWNVLNTLSFSSSAASLRLKLMSGSIFQPSAVALNFLISP